jgi:hypothetical protein
MRLTTVSFSPVSEAWKLSVDCAVEEPRAQKGEGNAQGPRTPWGEIGMQVIL